MDAANNYQRYSSPTNANNNQQQQQQQQRTATTNSNNQRQQKPSTTATTNTTAHQQTGRTTDLHRACSSPSSSLSKLRATLLALGKSSVSTKDEHGNLPLHLLGKNELLIHLFLNQAYYEQQQQQQSNSGLGYHHNDGGMMMLLWDDNDDWMSVGQHSAGRNGFTYNTTSNRAAGGGALSGGIIGGSGASKSPRTELDAFVIELVRAYPKSIITPDGNNGRLPLTDAIYDWIEYSSKDHNITARGGGAEIIDEDGNGNNTYPDGPSNLGMGSARGGGGGGGNAVSNLGSDRLEGMSQLMGADNNNNHDTRGGDRGSVNTGKRSILDNISLPSAFRSAYSASGRIIDDPENNNNGQSRASYRNAIGTDMNDPAVRQQAEFRNVWSATAPRPDNDGLDEIPQRSTAGAESGVAQQQQQQSVGQSDLISNPPEDAAIDDIFPLNLAMPPVVEWSLRMISIVLDGIEMYDGPLLLGGSEEESGEAFNAWGEGNNNNIKDGNNNETGSNYNGTMVGGGEDTSWISNSLVSSIASIPSLMKTLLLLNDNDPVKSRVFNLSIIRRVISSRYTIGNWLVYMLEAVDPIVARRGVDYLEILSEDEDENALIPSTKRVRYAGTQLSPLARAALYYKVSKLDYFLPAILALEETSEVDRAAKTKLLRHILDKELGSSPTLTMAFFDLFFLMMLLVTFQMSVYHVVEGGAYSAAYATTYFLSMIGVLYAILRKFGQMSSMLKISRQAFVENNFRWVDSIDWVAILLVIGGIIWMEVAISDRYVNVTVTDYMRSYLAAAICGVWLKLVSWLSVINWQVINLVSLFYQVSNLSSCDVVIIIIMSSLGAI